MLSLLFDVRCYLLKCCYTEPLSSGSETVVPKPSRFNNEHTARNNGHIIGYFRRLSDVIEPRFLATIGMVISAFSLFSLSFLASGELSAYFLISLVFIGVGFSLFSSPNTHAIMSSVTRKNYGLASGTAATTRVLGQLSSMFLISFSLSFIVGDQLITEETLPSLLDAIELSFFIAGFVCLLGALLSVTRGKLHE